LGFFFIEKYFLNKVITKDSKRLKKNVLLRGWGRFWLRDVFCYPRHNPGDFRGKLKLPTTENSVLFVETISSLVGATLTRC